MSQLDNYLKIYLIHLMKKLPSVMPYDDLLNGFPASHVMCNGQLLQMNTCSLNISKGHNTSLSLIITKNIY